LKKEVQIIKNYELCNKLKLFTSKTILSKKRILDDTISSIDENNSSESEYELHDNLVDYPPNICDEEKKLLYVVISCTS
jgi:hypothetical protein